MVGGLEVDSGGLEVNRGGLELDRWWVRRWVRDGWGRDGLEMLYKCVRGASHR